MEHNINHKYFEGVNIIYSIQRRSGESQHWLCAVRTAILSGVTWHLRWVIRVPRKEIGGTCRSTHQSAWYCRDHPRALKKI